MNWAIAADDAVVVARFFASKSVKKSFIEKWFFGVNKLAFVTDSS